MKVIQINGTKIYCLPVIKGLTSETEKVRRAYHKVKPESIAIPVSPEGLEALIRLRNGEENIVELSNYEEIYARKLASFGEVRVPPPCYEEGLSLALEDGIPPEPMDMDEVKFTDVFCRSVSGVQLVLHSLRVKRLRKKRFRAKTAEEFVCEWDRKVNSMKGFRAVENERERYMADKLVEISKKYTRILALLELERSEGIVKKILR